MEAEKNRELTRESMLNGGTKRRRNISSPPDSIAENGVDDHDRNRNRVFMNSVEWNRAFTSSQKKKKKMNKRNVDCYRGISEKSREGDNHRRSNRNRFSDGSFSSPPVIMTVDEVVIGVSVPRKIRSASVKRLNTNWSFRNAGFGRGLSHHQRFLPSSEVVAAGRSGYCASPQNVLLRKNMKSHGPKRELPKALGDSSLLQDDVEFEVVEALFDLMNQTHSELDRSNKSEMDLVSTSGSLMEQVAKKKFIKTSHLPHISDRNNGFVKKGMCLSLLNDDLMAEDHNNLAWTKYSVSNVIPESTMDVTAGKEVFSKIGAELLNDSKTVSSEKRVVAPRVVEKKDDENKVESNNFSQGASKYEHHASNSSGISELVEDGEEPNQLKGLISGGQESALHTSLPSPIFGVAWARDLPHPGSVPPFQIFMPDRNGRPLAALLSTPFLLSQCTRKRCVTHQYIAHNIFCHQQLIMNFTTLPVNSGSASIYKAKTPTPDALISKLIMTDGDEFKGEFMGKKMFSSLGGAGNNLNVSNDKQLMFQHASQQITTASVLGPALVGQLGQHHTLMVPPTNRNASTLLSNSVEGALGNSSLSPVVSYNHINFPSKPLPPYMTIFPNNGYPSLFSTANKGEQAPAMPSANGSYSSSPPYYVSETQTQESLS